MSNLTNSITTIQKATYVPLNIDLPETNVGRVTLKFGYIRQLNLQPGEVDAVRNSIIEAMPATSSLAEANFWTLLQQFEGAPLVSQLPFYSAFTNIKEADLIAFGKGLIAVRKQAVQRLQQANPSLPAPGVTAALPAAETPSLSIAQNHLNTSTVATNAFTANVSASNMGMLNLERLEMTPDGVERGALLATIPLAPKERAAVVQQEWSVITKEFTSIVTDSLENYSQTGVTENTQLAQSTTSQVAHSNQSNITASASGGIGFVSGSASASFGSQDQSSQSANDSRQHAIQTTRQASSRVKQSHKITISTTTVTGTSETSTRMFENPSATDPMRVDYFSLMRKWYVALYRYGLRLTYDIAIPEPGAAMREVYAQLADLQAKASQRFTFALSPTDLNSSNWQSYAAQYQATLSAPPPVTQEVSFTSTYSASGGAGYVYSVLELDLPDGYVVSSAKLTADQAVGKDPIQSLLQVMFVGQAPAPPNPLTNFDTTVQLDYLAGRSGKQFVTYGVSESPNGAIEVDVQLQDAGALAVWQQQSWAALYGAAQAAFYAEQQQVSGEIQLLQNKISNVDTLTLRREESDEIMKCVLRWLLGPNFEFMPSTLVNDLILANLLNPEAISNGVNFTGDSVNFPNQALDWSLMAWDQRKVNFINQAIDWDNVLYFLYSYFWDIPTSWDFIRQIQHPDSTRQAFLRAGSARVVLTVRKGWETAWAYYVETGSIPPPGPVASGSNPYLAIAQQIADYDNTNYPGIPPANPNGGGPIDDDAPQIGTTCASDIQPGAMATTPVTITVDSSAGFAVGAAAIIDTWNATDPNTGKSIQETQTITAVDTATNTITLRGLLHPHGGGAPVVQASAKGTLIGEWYEYTPTSGTDVAIATPSGTKYCDNGQFGNY